MTTPDDPRALADELNQLGDTHDDYSILYSAVDAIRALADRVDTLTTALAAAEADAKAARERVRELEASGGVAAIAAERHRQISEEGWTAEHDDQWISDELAMAAVCYLRHDPALCAPEAPPDWPWDENWWKPINRRRDLVRAGALIAAEIDRLDRERARAALGEGGK